MAQTRQAWSEHALERLSDAGFRRGGARQVVIELLDEAGQLISSYKLWGCWVSQYRALPELEAEGDGALIETLRLECEGWQRVEPA